MELVRPDYKLSIIGFNYDDVDKLNKVLEKMDLDLITDDSQVFDFSLFVYELIKSKSLREELLNNYYKVIPNLEEYLTINIGFEVASYHFKWYLFLLILIYKNNLPSEVKIYLDTDEAYHKELYSIFDLFFDLNRKKYLDLNTIYNKLMSVNEIERTGWLDADIPNHHKESISEHMFSMYHLVRFYLKDHSNIEGYNKDKITRLVMIHDLVESLIGDIAYPIKDSNDEIKEMIEGKEIFLAFMYLTGDSSYYDEWCEWCDNSTVNSLIAHDIDVIQFNYQFMKYAVKYPNHFSNSEIKKWMGRRPKTMLGIELFNKIIRENQLFSSIIDLID